MQKLYFGMSGKKREQKVCDFVTAEVAHGVEFFLENYNSGRLRFIQNTEHCYFNFI